MPSNRPGSLTNVEIFKPGTYYGRTWTRADVASITRNFYHFSAGESPIVPARVKIGHGDDGVRLFSESPEAANAGRVSALWTDAKGIMRANLRDVPRTVINAVRQRAYSAVSVELAHNLPVKSGRFGGISFHGPALVGLALLGGCPPAVRGLRPLYMKDTSQVSNFSEGKNIMIVTHPVYGQVSHFAGDGAQPGLEDLAAALSQLLGAPVDPAALSNQKVQNQIAALLAFPPGQTPGDATVSPADKKFSFGPGGNDAKKFSERAGQMSPERRAQLLKASAPGVAILNQQRRSR